jgi:hypothetical protein
MPGKIGMLRARSGAAEQHEGDKEDCGLFHGNAPPKGECCETLGVAGR